MTGILVTGPFDTKLRAARRDRAARLGPELFLHERAFADCLERIELTGQRFERALILGCPDPGWTARLRAIAESVAVVDPGPVFAAHANGAAIVEDQWLPDPMSVDLILAIGTLDTVNDLPLALRILFEALRSDGLLIGAMAGGETLPMLRSAMRAADRVAGAAAPHVHPRIEIAAVAPLLAQAGFADPVIDVDRVAVRYPSLARLVADLRLMGATNVLNKRPRRSLSRAALEAAVDRFGAAAKEGKSTETFEIIHFAAWRRIRG